MVSRSTDEKLAIFVSVSVPVSDLLRISVAVAPWSSSNETPAGLVLKRNRSVMSDTESVMPENGLVPFRTG